MSTYAIGDIQGCFQSLTQLLDKIQFDQHKDTLWFTGDLVNRGPHSLETLRFVKSLQKQAIVVLGNHDLTLLAVGNQAIPYNPHHHTFIDILHAPDCNELLTWLQHQPLLHHDPKLNFTLVHAGLAPQWDLSTAQSLAKEVESVLQGSQTIEFFKHLYGNYPDTWDPALKEWDRLRLIVNYFTRMRFCNEKGQLEFKTTGSAEKPPSGFSPWFTIPNRKSQDLNIVFGHWAALEGKSEVPTVFPLDTGCVWGNCLTALRLEDRIKISVQC